MSSERIGVVGAGIIGLAVARRMTQLRPEAVVTVLEKEDAIATHQTGRNSGVAHAGIYYAPGSLKAELCRRGVGLLRAYCEERGIRYVECGKVVVALDEGELDRLHELERRASANGVPGVRWLDQSELRELEPNVAGIAGLHSPTTAITDFGAVAEALRGDVGSAGGSVELGREVTRIEATGARVRVGVGEDELELDRLVVCAGLHADRLARRAGDEREPTIVPFRGEYYRLAPARTSLVRSLVYPVPDPAYPFLGVHFTLRVDGGVDVGPNAVLALSREGYRWRDVRLGDVSETLRYRASAASHGGTGGWACASCAARSRSARSTPTRAATFRRSSARISCGPGPGFARRRSTRTDRSSTTSGSAASGTSPPSGTRRHRAPRRASRSRSTSPSSRSRTSPSSGVRPRGPDARTGSGGSRCGGS